MNAKRFLATGLILFLASGLNAADQRPAGPPAPHWDLAVLGKPPATYPAAEPTAKDVKSLFYEGLSFQGKPTRVFAYYGAPKVTAGKKVSAMVLVHGGGGTAFDVWVRLWNSRGYAAIAMDSVRVRAPRHLRPLAAASVRRSAGLGRLRPN